MPISGVAGDQQASLFGQACFAPGTAKNTYGTGSFVLVNVGTTCPEPVDGLLTTVAWSLPGADGEPELTYAYEGAIFVTGAAVQWLRDGLGVIERSADVDALAASVPDSDGVVVVPAFTGLGSPWWDPYARGTILGITRGTTSAHIARATLEAMAFQTRDVVDVAWSAPPAARSPPCGPTAAPPPTWCSSSRPTSSASRSRRPVVADTTALGAAYLAGLAEGVWGSLDDITANWALDTELVPGPGRADGRRRPRPLVTRRRALTGLGRHRRPDPTAPSTGGSRSPRPGATGEAGRETAGGRTSRPPAGQSWNRRGDRDAPSGDPPRIYRVMEGWAMRDAIALSSRNRVSTMRANAAACLRSRARKAVPLRPSTSARPAEGSGAQATSAGP